jgi:hypothetical protein
MSMQPILIFEADLPGIQAAHRTALDRGIAIVPFIQVMFAPGHDEANRAVLRAEDVDKMNWAGIAARGPKRAVKGLKLRP